MEEHAEDFAASSSDSEYQSDSHSEHTLDELQLETADRPPATRKFACLHEGCSKTFSKSVRLEEHQRTHTGERPFACTYDGCGKTFRRATHMQRHMQQHDGSIQKQFVCDREGCDKAYNPVNYVCGETECQESFKTWSELRKHIRSQHVVKPELWKCEECGSEFTRKSSRDTHLRKKHGVGGTVELWPCYWEGCAKELSSRNALNVHVRTVHEDIRPFPCLHEGCGMQFGHKYILTRHMRTEHGASDAASSSSSQVSAALAQDTASVATSQELPPTVSLTGLDYVTARRLACPHTPCPYRFTLPHLLKRHIQAEHNGLDAPAAAAEASQNEGDPGAFSMNTEKSLKRKRYEKRQRVIEADGVTFASGFVEFARPDRRLRSNATQHQQGDNE
ncbi:hypothetical protein RI367_006624 [Sorochytrium milnesiophthora]